MGVVVVLFLFAGVAERWWRVTEGDDLQLSQDVPDMGNDGDGAGLPDENDDEGDVTPGVDEDEDPGPEEGGEQPPPPEAFADPYVPSPSPSPSPTGSPEPSPSPSPTESPEPSPSPTASPTESPQPSPSPTGTVAPVAPDEGDDAAPSPEDEGFLYPVLKSEPASGFEEASNERTELVQSIHDPTELEVTARQVAEAMVLTGVLILFLGFPSELFNATLLENYDEVTGWFSWVWLQRLRTWVAGLHGSVVVLGFAAVGALIHSQLEADLSFNKGSMALLLGLFAAFVTISLTYDVMRKSHLRHRYELPSRVRAQMLGMAVALIFVVISRIGDFHPGYMYGLFTALVYGWALNEKHHGRALALASIRLFVVALVAWFVWIPVKHVAEEPNAGFWILTLDASLSVLWVAGIAAIVFGLAPLRFLYGEAVKAWSFRGWLAIWIPGVFLFVYTLLHPERGLYGGSHEASLVSALFLFFGFGLFSVLFWGYFRLRDRRKSPAQASIR